MDIKVKKLGLAYSKAIKSVQSYKARFFLKPEKDNSPFGKIIQTVGVAMFVAGLYMVWPPLAFMCLGGAALIAGERL